MSFHRKISRRMLPAVAMLGFSLLGSRGTLPAEPGKIPAGLSASDWNSIRTEYERNRRAVFPVGSEYCARNPEQQWLARFDGRGFALEPDGAKWRWGLELESYGFAGHERTLKSPARVTVEKERVTYAWDGSINEWFVNDKRGLEHGFTLRQRPPGGGERLAVRLAVRGGLVPRVQMTVTA